MPKQTQTSSPSSNPEFHQPVLADSVMRLLDPEPGDRLLDLTAGYGGHARKIIDRAGNTTHHILVDRDAQAVDCLQRAFTRDNISIIHSDYESALNTITDGFDIVLIDSGVSSPQLDSSNRGFSFSVDAPLDMRMDQTRGSTAADILNTMPERDIVDILQRYGEERLSGRIARVIVENRPIITTKQLADIVTSVYKGKSRIHPATRTFQAVRIAVNDELGQLERTLPTIEKILNPGGRAAIISFHSLEDRIVKQFIRESSLQPLNKKVVHGKIEDVSNPRARSAKLRAAIKNTNHGQSRHRRDKTKTRR